MLTLLFVLVLTCVIVYVLGCMVDYHDYERYIGPHGQICTRIRKHHQGRAQ